MWGFTRDGVNGFNGNLVLQATDLHIPGRGVPVTFTRTYNSRATEDVPPGLVWTANVFAMTSAGGVTHTYDDNGNMTGDGTRTYVYDAANRLIEVKQGINSIALFAYDADGRRTSMIMSSGTVRFFYDGASTRVLYKTDGSGNLLARYVYGPNGQLLAMVRGGVTYYYHYNGHGDVVALTNAFGAVAATYENDAFGNHIATTGSVVNPYRCYAGYRWDAETGLYYLNARYYAPSVGRFITRDAFLGFEDDPASLNQYNYAHSNPIMFVDLSRYSRISVFSSSFKNFFSWITNWSNILLFDVTQ